MPREKYKRALVFALIFGMAVFLGLPSKTQALTNMWDARLFRSDIIIQGATYPIGPIIHGVPGGMPIVVGDHLEIHGEISRPFGPVIINDSLQVRDWSVFEGDIDFKEGITVDFTGVNVTGLTQAPGDILYASASNLLTRLGIGSTGQILQVSGGLPTWQSIGTIPAPGTQGQILYSNGSAWVTLAPGTSGQFLQTQGAGANPVWAAAAGGSLWTDGGTITYLTSITDDLTLGGTDSSAPFYFDVGAGLLTLDSLQVGGATDYLLISSTGKLKLYGGATVWDDLRVPMTSTKSGLSKIPGFSQFKDDGSGSQGVFTYMFDQNVEEELYFTVELPHGYKPGGSIYPHVHWIPTDTGTGNVVWGLEYTWANIYSTYGNTSIITVTDAADGTADKHQWVPFPAISGTGKTESSILVCRIFRDATNVSDTYNNDVVLPQMDFHYEIEKIGLDSFIH